MSIHYKNTNYKNHSVRVSRDLNMSKLLTILFKSFFVCVIAVFSITSCGGKKEVVLESAKAAEKPKVEKGIKLEKVWSINVGADFSSDSAGFQIKKDDDFLYVATQSGDIASIDINSGSINWKKELDDKLSAGLSVGLNALYVANIQGQVLALDKTSGNFFWVKQLSSEVLTSPIESQEVVIVRSLDGKISGLSTEKGDELWALKRDFPNLSLRRDVPPLLVGNVALFGLASGNITAVNIKAGQVVWDLPISTPEGINDLERMRDIASQPLISENLFFANSYQGEIISIDLSTRKFVWKLPISSHQQMTADDSTIYVTSTDSSIIALEAVNGNVFWKNDELLRRGVSAPTIFGKYILVFGNDADMYLFNKNDGELLGNYRFPGKKVIGQPIVFLDKKSGILSFSALSDNGNIYTYQVSK